MSLLRLTPLTSLNVSKHFIPSHNLIPNTSLHSHPLYIYHSCFPPSSSPSSIESHLSSTGVVTPQWRYTMYPRSHFHSTTHEVLCVFAGKALLCFGHESNPSKVEVTVKQGDAIIVPAGVAHRLFDDFSSRFEMVGSYPTDKSWDMCYGDHGEESSIEKMKKNPPAWFERDPLYGNDGPVVQKYVGHAVI